MPSFVTNTISRVAGFHRDQQGTISIVGVFSIILLAMLLGMVLNVGFQADSKVKMQNAADAASYSGGVVMARGMNSLAFTNHLLFDVFALTAFLREGAENHGEPMVPEILAAWNDMAGSSSDTSFTKFRNWHGEYVGVNYGFRVPHLGEAIQAKVPYEQQMVTSFSAWALAFSEDVLPTLEEILDNELIPEYQRAVVATIPDIAQLAANEVSIRHGRDRSGDVHPQRGPMQAKIWNSRATPVGGPWESQYRSLPVVDPVQDQVADQDYYLVVAQQQRAQLSQTYLTRWNREKLAPFLHVGHMSQFYGLWTGFTCGQLQKLLAENQFRNLPFVIRTPSDVIQAAYASNRGVTSVGINDVVISYPPSSRNEFLASQYMYVGAVYWRHVPHSLPGLFRNPLAGDHLNYAQFMLFLPRNRLVQGTRRAREFAGQWGVVRQTHPLHWDLLNQNWRVQLVPATLPALVDILKTTPDFDGAAGQPSQAVTLPDLGELTADDISVISHH